MRKVISAATIIFVGVFLLSICIITYTQNNNTLKDDKNLLINLAINSDYIPGNLMKHGCRVDLSYYPKNGIISCEVYDDNFIALSYDDKTQVIVSSTFSMFDKNKNVADFVMAYGIPTGTKRDNGIIYIYFGKSRYLWIPDGRLSPDSKVWFVSYSLKEEDNIKAWRGFTLN